MNGNTQELIRAIKYSIFSVSAGAIQAVSFVILEETVDPENWLSHFIALVLSVLWNFTLNRKYTFHSASNLPLAMLKVALYYLVFTPLSSWWTAVLTGEGIMWNKYLVEALTMAVNFVTEYLFMKFVVFADAAKK